MNEANFKSLRDNVKKRSEIESEYPCNLKSSIYLNNSETSSCRDKISLKIICFFVLCLIFYFKLVLLIILLSMRKWHGMVTYPCRRHQEHHQTGRGGQRRSRPAACWNPSWTGRRQCRSGGPCSSRAIRLCCKTPSKVRANLLIFMVQSTISKITSDH